MLRRYLSLPPWKRRLAALAVGLTLGAAVTTAIVVPQRSALKRFRDDYLAAQRTHEVAKLAALFDWTGVPAAERGRLKLALVREAESSVVSARLEPLRAGDGDPRDTREGRQIPNLRPVCRLSVAFGGADAGYSTWLVGRAADGYRLVVYRPATPEKP